MIRDRAAIAAIHITEIVAAAFRKNPQLSGVELDIVQRAVATALREEFADLAWNIRDNLQVD